MRSSPCARSIRPMDSMPPENPGGGRGRTRLAARWRSGCELLGTRHAILGGAMTWVSGHGLVAAISNAGGFGVIASGAMSPSLLDAEIARTRDSTDKPFGVNIIIMHPELDALIDVCGRRAVSHVVLAGGLPARAAIDRIRGHGAKALAFAPALVVARKLVRAGIDALIIEGMEAGGHTGPVATGVLAQEMLPEVKEVPVFVAGGIGRGVAIAMYLEMGAAGCQLGTRFVCARESIAHPDFKKAFIPRPRPRRRAVGPGRPPIPGHTGAGPGQHGQPALRRDPARGDRALPRRRDLAGRRPARDRAFLGRRAAPRRRRWRYRERLADGRPERRHGDARAVGPPKSSTSWSAMRARALDREREPERPRPLERPLIEAVSGG